MRGLVNSVVEEFAVDKQQAVQQFVQETEHVASGRLSLDSRPPELQKTFAARLAEREKEWQAANASLASRLQEVEQRLLESEHNARSLTVENEALLRLRKARGFCFGSPLQENMRLVLENDRLIQQQQRANSAEEGMAMLRVLWQLCGACGG